MKYNIVVLPGDGIGPEIITAAKKVLAVVGGKCGHEFNCTDHLIGGAAIDAVGCPLPEATVDACLQADAVLLGAVGGYKWDALAGELRPEAGLLKIREKMGVFANLRPALVYKELIDASPLKGDIIKNGMDIMIVRELTGGIYFGKRGNFVDEQGLAAAYDTETYNVEEITRVTKVACDIAKKRSGKITSVDKANVLDTSRLWRKTVEQVVAAYGGITLNHLYVDNTAMQLVSNPGQFDVILTNNIFGDILSDEASMITGSIGMLPSASIGTNGKGLFEPIHGSAPDIAGQDKANPLATILSLSMMLRYSLDLNAEAALIEAAVGKTLEQGYRTPDIYCAGQQLVGTVAMADAVIANL